MQDAIRVLKSGDRERAFEMLQAHLEQHPRDANAWIWLSEAAPTTSGTVMALEQALVVAPDHEHAGTIQRRINDLRSGLGMHDEPQPGRGAVSDFIARLSGAGAGRAGASSAAQDTTDATLDDVTYDGAPVARADAGADNSEDAWDDATGGLTDAAEAVSDRLDDGIGGEDEMDWEDDTRTVDARDEPLFTDTEADEPVYDEEHHDDLWMPGTAAEPETEVQTAADRDAPTEKSKAELLWEEVTDEDDDVRAAFDTGASDRDEPVWGDDASGVSGSRATVTDEPRRAQADEPVWRDDEASRAQDIGGTKETLTDEQRRTQAPRDEPVREDDSDRLDAAGGTQDTLIDEQRRTQRPDHEPLWEDEAAVGTAETGTRDALIDEQRRTQERDHTLPAGDVNSMGEATGSKETFIDEQRRTQVSDEPLWEDDLDTTDVDYDARSMGGTTAATTAGAASRMGDDDQAARASAADTDEDLLVAVDEAKAQLIHEQIQERESGVVRKDDNTLVADNELWFDDEEVQPFEDEPEGTVEDQAPRWADEEDELLDGSEGRVHSVRTERAIASGGGVFPEQNVIQDETRIVTDRPAERDEPTPWWVWLIVLLAVIIVGYIIYVALGAGAI